MKIINFPKFKEYTTTDSIHGYIWPFKLDINQAILLTCDTIDELVAVCGPDQKLLDGHSVYHRIQDVVETIGLPITLVKSNNTDGSIKFHPLEQTFGWMYKASPAKRLNFIQKFMNQFLRHPIDDGFIGVQANAAVINDIDDNILAVVYFDGPTAVSAVDSATCTFTIDLGNLELELQPAKPATKKPATQRKPRKKP
jgi:hypothetical protein